ncbi:MAG: hypothetical protein KJP25_07405 [Gammaproteobacteria bacterium]|nr:hypothetical protein [Gammaproteobacteria bacterium]MBT8152208.1 hypothetical protein [Gammaproteobacteria bacterium]NNM11494.1 hypothetical protein [Pseudomonadales bacterium]
MLFNGITVVLPGGNAFCNEQQFLSSQAVTGSVVFALPRFTVLADVSIYDFAVPALQH